MEILAKLDNSEDCPIFMVSSRDLINVPITSISNRDVVPLGSRMDGLEKTVATLVKSIEDLKNSNVKEVPKVVIEQPEPTFASVAATAANKDTNNRTVGAKVDERRGNASNERVQPRQRLPSTKRKNEGEPDDDGFQVPKRRARKVNYGKSNVTVAGGEAAPYEVFIGNTNPASTDDIIKQTETVSFLS